MCVAQTFFIYFFICLLTEWISLVQLTSAIWSMITVITVSSLSLFFRDHWLLVDLSIVFNNSLSIDSLWTNPTKFELLYKDSFGGQHLTFILTSGGLFLAIFFLMLSDKLTGLWFNFLKKSTSLPLIVFKSALGFDFLILCWK